MLRLRKDFDMEKLEIHSRHTTKMREERGRHHQALQNERERHKKEKLAMLKDFKSDIKGIKEKIRALKTMVCMACCHGRHSL